VVRRAELETKTKVKGKTKVKSEIVNEDAAVESPAARRALIVTTAHKGVFFGYGPLTMGKVVRLEEVQMAVYWSADCHGILGLAADGPTKGCKVGPPAPAMTLQDVTSVIEVSAKAEVAWKKQPWN
jgi:hypothetical protein